MPDRSDEAFAGESGGSSRPASGADGDRERSPRCRRQRRQAPLGPVGLLPRGHPPRRPRPTPTTASRGDRGGPRPPRPRASRFRPPRRPPATEVGPDGHAGVGAVCRIHPRSREEESPREPDRAFQPGHQAAPRRTRLRGDLQRRQRPQPPGEDRCRRRTETHRDHRFRRHASHRGDRRARHRVRLPHARPRRPARRRRAGRQGIPLGPAPDRGRTRTPARFHHRPTGRQCADVGPRPAPRPRQRLSPDLRSAGLAAARKDDHDRGRPASRRGGERVPRAEDLVAEHR